MNYSNTTTIEDVNREIFLIMIPSIIFVCILMPIGVFGNAIALYIYGFRFKKLPVHIFLISLSVFDMIGCFFGIPLEIVGSCYPAMYPSRILCKLEKFLIFYSSITSAVTLFVIAVERYNIVCRHDKQQLSIRQAKITAAIIGFLSIAIASCGAVFFDKMVIPISPNLVAEVCMFKPSYEKFFQAYFFIYLIIDLIILVIMLLLYYRIWIAARKHANYIASLNVNGMNESQQTLTAYANIRQTNKILVSITFLFAFSFIPSLIFAVAYPQGDEKLPKVVESLRQFGYRMWYFNGAMNPIVYGLLNSRFRQIFLTCLRK